MQFYDGKTSLAEERLVRVAMTGTGAAAPTKRYGQGVTITRTAAGVIKLTFKEQLGEFVGVYAPMFGADTPSGVKGYSISRDTYDSSTKSIEISLWDASNNAVDLAAAQYLELEVVFAATQAAA